MEVTRDTLLFLMQAIFVLIISQVLIRALYNLTFHPLAKYPGPWYLGAFKFPYIWSEFRGTFVHSTRNLHDRYGPVVRIKPDALSFTTAQAWKDIYGTRYGKRQLQKDEEWFVDHSEPVNIIKSNDADHARIRRNISYAFSDSALRDQEPLLSSYTQLLVKRLKDQVLGPTNGKVNMVDWYNFLTFDVIGDLCFGESFDALKIGKPHFWISQIFVGLKLWRILRFGKHYVIPRLLLKTTMAMMPGAEEQRDSFFKVPRGKVERRLASDTDRKDFMSYIVRDKGHGSLSQEEIIETGCIFITGGSETTATLLCGLTYYMLKNPEVYSKLKEEVRSSFEREEDIKLSNIQKLEYLSATINEALRMYPPASSIFPRRTGEVGEVIDGQFVPPNTAVGVHQFATYHSSRNFADPDRFAPERWLDNPQEKYKDDDKASFQPFHLGPRGCIGKNLALFEIQSVVARLVYNFDMELCQESGSWDQQKVFIIWDKHPLYVKLSLREQSEL